MKTFGVPLVAALFLTRTNGAIPVASSASPDLKRAIDVLMISLPNRSLFVFEGQEHNAMDNVPQQFAEVVTKFLLDTKTKAD
jgi:hypothetical protein